MITRGTPHLWNPPIWILGILKLGRKPPDMRRGETYWPASGAYFIYRSWGHEIAGSDGWMVTVRGSQARSGGFLNHGGTPSSHPFLGGISPYKTRKFVLVIMVIVIVMEIGDGS